MRAMVLEGWEWGIILTGVWVAGVMLAVLLVAFQVQLVGITQQSKNRSGIQPD